MILVFRLNDIVFSPELILSYAVCSALTRAERSSAAGHQRPLPSIAALVPRNRISSTLPTFTIPVPDFRMSSTMPTSSGSTKLSMPGTARRAIRQKDVNRRDRGSRQLGRSKPRRSDKHNELVLRVVPIDISTDDGRSSCQQQDAAVNEVEAHCTSDPDDGDDLDVATWQFQRTARLRQAKYFKKSGRRSVSESAHSTNEHRQQVFSLVFATALIVLVNNISVIYAQSSSLAATPCRPVE